MKHLSIPGGHRPNQSGFSLIDVLVSLVVLSTGLLSMANLQVSALRGNHGAYLASVAAQQAQDMAERMKANPAGVAADEYDAIDSDIPTVQVNCQNANCAPDQLAVFDRNRWNAANQALLPAGGGQVSDIGGGVFLIAVRWHDRQLEGATGWQVNTETATACGAPQAGTRCFFLRYQA